jgi:hypothetical protein
LKGKGKEMAKRVLVDRKALMDAVHDLNDLRQMLDAGQVRGEPAGVRLADVALVLTLQAGGDAKMERSLKEYAAASGW